MSFNGQVEFTEPYKNVKLLTIKTDKFKTSKITVKLLLPLNDKTVSSYALFPFYLVRSNSKYKSPKELSDRLAELYGANLNVSINKNGDNLEILFAVSSIANRLALNGEDILSGMSDIIFDTIFSPNLENDRFAEGLFESEQRLAIERIESEINEKRVYAINTAIKEMCSSEPFGIGKYGTVAEVKALSAKSLYNAYQDALKTANFYVTVISENDTDIAKRISSALDAVGNTGGKINSNILKPARESVKNVSESMELSQGKLVMGFRSDKELSVKESVKSKVMVDVFGGGPYSLLFENVREKQSLCYYCASRYDRKKGIILVDSGVEQSNLTKAKEEILKNYELIENGEFDPAVLDASKTALSQAYFFVEDSVDGLDVWYSGQFDEDEILTPDSYSKLISDVSYCDVVEASKLYAPDVVFTLQCK